MNCQYNDCKNKDKKCLLCVDGLYYKPTKKISYKRGLNIKTKQTKRQGSISEVKSYEQTKQALNTSVTGTPNSGAGKIKGETI